MLPFVKQNWCAIVAVMLITAAVLDGKRDNKDDFGATCERLAASVEYGSGDARLMPVAAWEDGRTNRAMKLRYADLRAEVDSEQGFVPHSHTAKGLKIGEVVKASETPAPTAKAAVTEDDDQPVLPPESPPVQPSAGNGSVGGFSGYGSAGGIGGGIRYQTTTWSSPGYGVGYGSTGGYGGYGTHTVYATVGARPVRRICRAACRVAIAPVRLVRRCCVPFGAYQVYDQVTTCSTPGVTYSFDPGPATTTTILGGPAVFAPAPTRTRTIIRSTQQCPGGVCPY